MAPDRREGAWRSDETVRTEQMLRLIHAFMTLDSPAAREALLMLVEHLAEARERSR